MPEHHRFLDVQGAQVVKESVPDALLIFVVPPSLDFSTAASRNFQSLSPQLRQP